VDVDRGDGKRSRPTEAEGDAGVGADFGNTHNDLRFAAGLLSE
jgi:hypothetical protein